MERNELRKKIIQKRDEMLPDQRTEKSRLIQQSILGSHFFKKATTILTYVDFRSEVNTQYFIRKCLDDSKIIAVPFTLVEESKLLAVEIHSLKTDLQPGYCSIPEPVPQLIKSSCIDPQQIDVVIVPGSVFDAKGGRLGYGGGFYDRFLSQSSPGAIRVALAYELQMVDNVPMEEHDQFMDIIVTENTMYHCR